MFVIDVATTTAEIIEQDYSDYERLSPPTVCSNLSKDASGVVIENTSFTDTYLPSGSTVYEKTTTFTNTSCNVATLLPIQTSPVLSNPIHLVDEGTIDTNTALRSSVVASTTSTDRDWET